MNRHARRVLEGHVTKRTAAHAIARLPAFLVGPMIDAYQELGRQLEESPAIQQKLLEDRMATAEEIVASPEYQAKLKAMVEDQAIASLRSPSFVRDLDDLVKKAIRDIAVDVLAERLKEAEAKITAIVERDWDTQVAKVAHDLLDQELGKIRKRIL